VIIICHGLACHKNWRLLPKLSNDIISATGCCTFRFDFSGCGDSDGHFEFGGYIKYVSDLRAAITCLRTGNGRVNDTTVTATLTTGESKGSSGSGSSGNDSYSPIASDKFNVAAIVGHSMGGNIVLLYTAKYDDIPLCINMSARYYMANGIRVGTSDASRQSLSTHGYCDEMMEGRLRRITTSSLAERSATDMTVVKNIRHTRVMTLHGTNDRAIPVADTTDGLAKALTHSVISFHNHAIH
jgi:pimeloyl-ACP methyl ester carboxylesterase